MGNAITKLFADINNKDWNMSEEYKNRLKGLLRSLFQFDSADLDFGIYRIMNKKRNEIERFIEKDLIDAVDAELGKYSDSKQVNLRKEAEAIKTEIREKLGDDALNENDELNQIYVTTPFAKDLAERYKKAHVALKDFELSSQHEAEIFSHIYQFFSRYYDNGDFMSLRRYSQKEKYAIPYNGEEVVLHWANKDQYYIKTGEYFKNYSFKMGEYTVEFHILEAEGTVNNNKAESRYFVLSASPPVYDASKKLLTVFFEYRDMNKDEEKEYGTKNVQDSIIMKMKGVISSQVKEEGLKAALNKIVDKETEKTAIEKHLKAYTQRNTTDYFIHKDLKGFLSRELDFYLKNEVLQIDDLGTENEVETAQYISRMRVIKSICLKIIDFLSQIEDFQKMLFEKKKFVVRTDYCMTLDNVPQELYPDILKNKDQLNEWKALYGAGEGKQSTITSFGIKSIDEAYLKEHPYLALDTKFFDREYKDELLASFDDLDEATGGLMIKSENWQALNLMQEKYREKVKCTYIDPPYNTEADRQTGKFLYKDTFEHSTWIAFMENRLSLAKSHLIRDGVIFVSIDENEVANLSILLKYIFNNDPIAQFIWKGRSGKAGTIKAVSNQHEYVLSYSPETDEVQFSMDERTHEGGEYSDEDGNYSREQLRQWGQADRREDRPKMWFGIPNPLDNNKMVFPIKDDDSEGRWRVGEKTAFQLLQKGSLDFVLKNGKWQVYKKIREGKVTYSAKGTILENVGTTAEGTKIIQSLFGDKVFGYPKPTQLIRFFVELSTIDDDDVILDFFAGSGTTAHAVLDINKEESSNRKYILVEMGDYFDTIMKPRIQKVMYSDNWKDGKPQSNDGISHIFKYQCLEQYEDTLNNIEFKDAGSYQRTLYEMDGYFLRYMLDFETRESSPCRFNVEKLTNPFDYTLRIIHGNEMKDEKVDIVETFNYLLGIHVKQIKTFNNNGTYYRVVFGKKNEDEIAIIWRDTNNLDLKALQADKAFIEGTILSGINPAKTYINADFYVEGALPIEPEFKKLMVV